MDAEQVAREAVERAQTAGIIFIDELDKVAGRGKPRPRGLSEGVQRDLLPIVEGTTVTTKYLAWSAPPRPSSPPAPSRLQALRPHSEL